MADGQITDAVAPCSLLCYTCFGYKEGGISTSRRTANDSKFNYIREAFSRLKAVLKAR